MKLSIIVPTYNVENLIANCLDSLLDQDILKENYEILVINDGSTDSSAKIAASYANNYQNVILINQKNKGLSGARNTGISYAKGKYIYFIDSDDYIAKNTLGLIISLLEKHKLDVMGIKEIQTNRLNLKESTNINTINTDNLKVTDGITFIADNYYLNNAWWYFIRTEFLKKTKLTFPVGRLVEDANFTSKLLIAAQKITYIPLDFYRYYQRSNSIMNRTNIVHINRLISDYEKNIYEFDKQLKLLQNYNHPKIEKCIERIEARQHSFAFFQLVKSIRFGLPKKEVSNIIKRLKNIGIYPINKFLNRDYNRLKYKLLLLIINNEKLLFVVLKLNSFFRKKTDL